MDAKHTVGWVVVDNAAHGVHVYSAGGPFGGGKHIARVSNTAGVDIRANARLIAAAPCLLQALEGMLDRYTGLVNCGDCGNWDPEEEPCVIAARAAIARARGA